NLADGYVTLARLERDRGRKLEAEALFKQGLALDPNNHDGLHCYSSLIGEVGRLKEGFAMRQRLQALEPFVSAYNAETALFLWVDGQDDAAIAMLKALPTTSIALPAIYASQGRLNDAADALLSIPAGSFAPGQVEQVAQLLRAAPSALA